MINTNHRHKLIEGLVVAMGKPQKSGGGGDYGSSDPGKAEPDEGSPEEENQDEDEGMKCARDLARALDIGDLDDAKAKAVAEAIRTIASDYKQ